MLAFLGMATGDSSSCTSHYVIQRGFMFLFFARTLTSGTSAFCVVAKTMSIAVLELNATRKHSMTIGCIRGIDSCIYSNSSIVIESESSHSTTNMTLLKSNVSSTTQAKAQQRNESTYDEAKTGAFLAAVADFLALQYNNNAQLAASNKQDITTTKERVYSRRRDFKCHVSIAK